MEGRSTEVEFRFISGANDSDDHRSPPLGVALGVGGTSGQSYMLRPPNPSAHDGQILGVIAREAVLYVSSAVTIPVRLIDRPEAKCIL